MSVFLPLAGTMFIIGLVCRVLIVAALIDAATRPANAYLAADKQTKPFWILVLVLGFFIFLVGVIAALVYCTDVRPAVRGVGGGSSGRGSSSHAPDGPSRGYPPLQLPVDWRPGIWVVAAAGTGPDAGPQQPRRRRIIGV